MSLSALRAELLDPEGPFGGRASGYGTNITIDPACRAALVERAAAHAVRLHPSCRHHTQLVSATWESTGPFEVYAETISVRTVALGLAGPLVAWEQSLRAGGSLLADAFPDLADVASLAALADAPAFVRDALTIVLGSQSRQAIMGGRNDYAVDPVATSQAHETLAVLLSGHLGGDVPFHNAGQGIAVATRIAVTQVALAAGVCAMEPGPPAATVGETADRARVELRRRVRQAEAGDPDWHRG